MKRRTLFVKRVTTVHWKEEESAQPAYAAGFGVAGAHLSRRSESEGGTSLRAVVSTSRRPMPNVEVKEHRSTLAAQPSIEDLASSIALIISERATREFLETKTCLPFSPRRQSPAPPCASHQSCAPKTRAVPTFPFACVRWRRSRAAT